MSCAGKRRDRDFDRLANIEDRDALAAIETRLECQRIYVTDLRQSGVPISNYPDRATVRSVTVLLRWKTARPLRTSAARCTRSKIQTYRSYPAGAERNAASRSRCARRFRRSQYARPCVSK